MIETDQPFRDRDIRHTNLFREAIELHDLLRHGGSGKINDAAELAVSPDGRSVLFTGSLTNGKTGAQETRICEVDLGGGDVRILTNGAGDDRCARYSPDGRSIAFLSDRGSSGNFQLYLFDRESGQEQPCAEADGWVEYLEWSPDGRQILLGVAAHGADRAAANGAIASAAVQGELPDWMPDIASSDDACGWRSIWMYSVEDERLSPASPSGLNVWEARWCGSDQVALIGSRDPTEGAWFSSRLCLLGLETGRVEEIYAPQDQVGALACSPSGRFVAFAEAICSDRDILAGTLLLWDRQALTVIRPDTEAIDVSHLQWIGEDKLLLAGHRGLTSVVALHDVSRDRLKTIWSSDAISSVGFHFRVGAIGGEGDCALIGQGFDRAPEISVIQGGVYQPVITLDPQYRALFNGIAEAEVVEWTGRDGLQLHGWLLRPTREGPYPLVMNIHGGPVWNAHPTWLGRFGISSLMLLRRGYAIFLPNPRGSSGFGRAFAAGVMGDMGGADADDLISGIEHLIAEKIADPERLGVTGVSYGGYMSCWLVTQTDIFAAAVPVAPITNHVTEYLLSNIPDFCSRFLIDRYDDPAGDYFRRSPLFHARRVKTPVMTIAGALDRCTPPEEAAQFHAALGLDGKTSVLVTYPKEGHGVKNWPASCDYAARVVNWFGKYMPGS
jgi:dipeptidyl aminopeptidase/acylaminoacyl peptidase